MSENALRICYRDHDRTPLLFVLKEMAAKHENLELEIEQIVGTEEYEQGFLRGELPIICEHIRFLYPARRDGHPVRCLAACGGSGVDRLIARPEVRSMDDLVGKTIAIRGTESTRFSTLHWLKYLGLADSCQVIFADDRDVGRWQQWRKVASGEADAATCSPLYQDAPLAAGLHFVEGPALPSVGQIFFAALGPFVESHQDELRRLIRALYRALHTFHHDPATTKRIMAGEPARRMGIKDDATLQSQYERLRDGLGERPIPRPEAVASSLAMLQDQWGGLEDVNPLALWDLRFVLQVEEEGLPAQLAAG